MHILRLSLAALAFAPVFASTAASETLCSADEEVIFSCKARHKIYEVCASKDITATSGYMQYRAGSQGKIEFVYPEQRIDPAGKFRFSLLARGAKLSFQNGEFTYEIAEPLIGTPQIWVSRKNGNLTIIECQDHSDALTLTTTQNRFKNLGIHE